MKRPRVVLRDGRGSTARDQYEAGERYPMARDETVRSEVEANDEIRA